MKKNAFMKYVLITVILLLCLALVAKVSGPTILRRYVESGIGNCQKIPVLCLTPETEIINPAINADYLKGLLPYVFTDMRVCLPKDFIVAKEQVTKVYYKKNPRKHKGAVVYLLYEKPDFFINLFPQLHKQGIKNDYEFIKRIMYAKMDNIKGLNDVFFAIMKGVFIPDLGKEKNVKMAQFIITDKRGIINYSLSKPENYFDCNIFNKQGDFFKIYIKDSGASLDLDKALAIISTVDSVK